MFVFDNFIVLDDANLVSVPLNFLWNNFYLCFLFCLLPYANEFLIIPHIFSSMKVVRFPFHLLVLLVLESRVFLGIQCTNKCQLKEPLDISQIVNTISGSIESSCKQFFVYFRT